MKPINVYTPPKTGHAPFDDATTSILSGNVSGDTQSSGFVRAHSDTTMGSVERPPGALQDFDLKHFRDYLGMDAAIEAEVRAALVDRPGILYAFFSPETDAEDRRIHGLLLTGVGAALYEPLGRWQVDPAPHAARILDAMQDWLTYPAGTRAKAEAAKAAFVEGLSELSNPQVDAVMEIAREAEDAFPNFGAWRLLTDVGQNDWETLPPFMARFEPAIAAVLKSDPKAFRRAGIAISNALADLYDASFGAGVYVDASAAMSLVREAVGEYPAPSAAPSP